MRILLTNLDFEYHWAAISTQQTYQRTPTLTGLCRRWERVLRILQGEQHAHCIALNAQGQWSIPSESIESFECWGVTPEIENIARTCGFPDLFPPSSSVCKVNDKCYSHRLEVDFGISLPHSGLVDSPESLQSAIISCPFDWVAKHPWGVSGRERIQGKAGHLEERHLRWAQRQFARGWSLVFEPWMQVQEEFSMHFDIEASGEVHYIGACKLVADGSGTYRGNRCEAAFSPDPMAISAAQQAVAHTATQGYFGPIGIDAMQGHLGSLHILRPIVEINARYTFGRMTLEMERFFSCSPRPFDWTWEHPTAKEAERIRTAHPNLVHLPATPTDPGLYLLPQYIDPDGQSGTFIEIH